MANSLVSRVGRSGPSIEGLGRSPGAIEYDQIVISKSGMAFANHFSGP